jgi:DNA-binding IclR family transcriptional regulator
MPLYASASGLVLLAGAENASLVGRIIRQGIHPLTPDGIQDGAELRASLRQVGADGFAVTSGHVHPDSRGIAVPVRGPLGDLHAAMGVVVPNSGAPVRPVVDSLRWAAARITQALADLYSTTPNEEIPVTGAPVYSGVSRNSLSFLVGLTQTSSPRATDPPVISRP